MVRGEDKDFRLRKALKDVLKALDFILKHRRSVFDHMCGGAKCLVGPVVFFLSPRTQVWTQVWRVWRIPGRGV